MKPEIDVKKVIKRATSKVRTRTLDSNSEAIIEKLSAQYDVPVSHIRTIIASPFKHWKAIRSEYTIDDFGFPNIRVPVLGAFVVTGRSNLKKRYIEYYKEKNNIK